MKATDLPEMSDEEGDQEYPSPESSPDVIDYEEAKAAPHPDKSLQDNEVQIQQQRVEAPNTVHKITKPVMSKMTKINAESPNRGEKIKIKQNEKKYDGSLLRLFKSDFFNVHMLIRYLFTREQGIQDYLVNVLYKEDIEDIDFYLPQLCYICLIKQNTQSIQRFILDMCLKHSNFALKAQMYVNAYNQDEIVVPKQIAEDVTDTDDKQLGSFREKCDTLYGYLEQTIINNQLPHEFKTPLQKKREAKMAKEGTQ